MTMRLIKLFNSQNCSGVCTNMCTSILVGECTTHHRALSVSELSCSAVFILGMYRISGIIWYPAGLSGIQCPAKIIWFTHSDNAFFCACFNCKMTLKMFVCCDSSLQLQHTNIFALQAPADDGDSRMPGQPYRHVITCQPSLVSCGHPSAPSC